MWCAQVWISGSVDLPQSWSSASTCPEPGLSSVFAQKKVLLIIQGRFLDVQGVPSCALKKSHKAQLSEQRTNLWKRYPNFYHTDFYPSGVATCTRSISKTLFHALISPRQHCCSLVLNTFYYTSGPVQKQKSCDQNHIIMTEAELTEDQLIRWFKLGHITPMKLWNIWSSRVYVSNENNMGLFSLVFLPSPTVLVEKFGVSLFVGLVLYSESNHHNDLWCVFKAKDGTYGMPKIGILRHFLLWKKML